MYVIHENCIYFTKNCFFSEDNFLSMAGVKKGTFAGNIFKNMYSSTFGSAISLSDEYLQYYSCEFGSFKEYLMHRYFIHHSTVDEYLKQELFYNTLMYSSAGRFSKPLEWLKENDILYYFCVLFLEEYSS